MKIRKIVLVMTIAMIGLIGLVGCKKKEEPVSKAPTLEKVEKQAAATAKEAEKATTTMAEEAKKTVAAAEVEQTMCPIMDGNKIDKNVFVEYKGKKVYFCCSACKAEFEKEPEKYIAKLPQFAK